MSVTVASRKHGDTFRSKCPMYLRMPGRVYTYRPGFFSVSAIDICGQVILHFGGLSCAL